MITCHKQKVGTMALENIYYLMRYSLSLQADSYLGIYFVHNTHEGELGWDLFLSSMEMAVKMKMTTN